MIRKKFLVECQQHQTVSLSFSFCKMQVKKLFEQHPKETTIKWDNFLEKRNQQKITTMKRETLENVCVIVNTIQPKTQKEELKNVN